MKAVPVVAQRVVLQLVGLRPPAMRPGAKQLAVRPPVARRLVVRPLVAVMSVAQVVMALVALEPVEPELAVLVAKPSREMRPAELVVRAEPVATVAMRSVVMRPVAMAEKRPL